MDGDLAWRRLQQRGDGAHGSALGLRADPDFGAVPRVVDGGRDADGLHLRVVDVIGGVIRRHHPGGNAERLMRIALGAERKSFVGRIVGPLHEAL